MPFFCFSINKIKPHLKKYNITSNKLYFSKNTQIWKILNKEESSIVNFIQQQKRLQLRKIGKKILFCLPPSIGLGDAIEYSLAIKTIIKSGLFQKIGVAFLGDYKFLFKDSLTLINIYSHIIEENEINQYDTIFHFTLEIKSLINQKYSRSNIYEEVTNYFEINDEVYSKKKKKLNQKISKISIFPLSTSPIRTMPIKLLNELVKFFNKDYDIEIFLDKNSDISNFIINNLNFENVSIIDPINKIELFTLIKKIQYGLFMDSGPLHVAKIFEKKGILLETSVSSSILLKNYNLIKGIKNTFTSAYCKAPCGLTDIFNYNNNFGCYQSLKIKGDKIKNEKFNSLITRGVKNKYLENFKNPVGCISNLNVHHIIYTIKKELET